MSCEREIQRNVNHNICLPRPQNTFGHVGHKHMEKHPVVLTETKAQTDKEDSKVAVGPLVLAQGQTASRWQRPDWTSSFNSKTQLCYFTMQTGGPGAIYSPQMWFFIDIWPAQFHKFKAAYNSNSESYYENTYCSNSEHPLPAGTSGPEVTGGSRRRGLRCQILPALRLTWRTRTHPPHASRRFQGAFLWLASMRILYRCYLAQAT